MTVNIYLVNFLSMGSSSISLGHRRPSSNLGFMFRSIQPSNMSLVQVIHPITHSNSGEDVNKPSETVEDTSRMPETPHTDVFGAKMNNNNFNFEVRCLTDMNILNNEDEQKVKNKIHQHKITYHHQRLKALTTKQRQQLRAKLSSNLSRLNSLNVKLSLMRHLKVIQNDMKLMNVLTPQFMIRNSKEEVVKSHDTVQFNENTNIYKGHLFIEIISWLLNIPVFYSLDFSPKTLKNYFADPLANKLEQLLNDVHDPSYETKVKKEINDCLDVLPMWLPYTKTERVRFKNELCEIFYKKLKKLNYKFTKRPTNDKDDVETNNKSDTKSETELNRQKDIISNEIHNWLNKIPFDKPMFRLHIVEFMITRLSPLLSIHNYKTSYKLMLKEEIVDIINKLPIKCPCGKNRLLYTNKIAEELACRLIRLKLQFLYSKQITDKVIYRQCTSEVKGLPVHTNLVDTLHTKVNNALENTKVQNKKDVEREICGVVLNSIETLRKGLELNTNIQIFDILQQIGNIDEDTAMKIAKNIKIYIKIALIQDKETNNSTKCMQCKTPDVISIYRSSIDSPVTSTPKQPTKKHVPRLNVGEISYMEKVAALIRSAMDTLPTLACKYCLDDNQEYKNIVIYDLAGDIMDEVKRDQLSPEMNIQKDKHLKYYVLRWLAKFGFFDDLNDGKPWVETFLYDLKQIPVPDLTAPQYGSRQAMENLKLVESEFGWQEDFVPRGMDILEDQISVWLHDQPSEIYSKRYKKNHDKLVKKLALKLQDDLRKNSPESQIETDINVWLNDIVSHKEKENLELLTQDLKEKIMNVPQDRTLEARNIKRQKQKAEYRQKAPTALSISAERDTISSIEDSPEKTMKQFIVKYIEQNYDVEDPMVRGALSELLILELRRVVPPIREEVYENFAKGKKHEKFRPEQLNEVLEYIKIISDWLKNLPIHPLYNTPGHRPRVDFVNDLARNIQEVEDKRKQNPNAMDYDFYIFSVIGESMRTYNIPMLPEHKQDINIMINQLLLKIIANRSVINESNLSNISDIKEQTLSEFIEDYIRLNGREIADDEVKLEAWTARLLEEVKKMINEGADPRTINKAQVSERFAQVQALEDEPVKRFDSEMLYVKEISDWLKNLPLIPLHENSCESQKERILMITELAQKFANTNANTRNSSISNTQIGNKQLEDYITTWISKLPLDPCKDVEVPLLIQQLLKRINKVDKTGETLAEELSGEEIFPTRSKPTNIEFTQDPGTHMVQFIEDWCNKLPIGEDDDINVKQMKNNIANNLYKRIGELNADPKIYNNDLLFKDLLEDEIDTQLENVPQGTELQNSKAQLKISLVDTILDMKNVIEKKSTGDNYKRKLETSIDTSIPNPVHSRQVIEPGFEIYKNHLASMFILDNFDHSDDAVKAKYENRIRDEVDKYFMSAVNKNALPMSKDQLYNELYSELFKVPMPEKESIGDKVEEIKTRYEIDAWFDELPIKRTDDLFVQLEWDRILSTLAERIHHIEKYEPEPDEKIRTEIMKWLLKLPLQPGQEANVNNFVEKLQNVLKDSAIARKYVPYDPKNKGKDIVKQSKPARNKSLYIPSSKSKPCMVSPPSSPNVKPKRSGDLIVEIVEEWCNQLPLIGDEMEVNLLKDDISTKIVLKVCELNNDSEIFNDDILYDHLLDEGLGNLMADIPTNDDFEASKLARKHQLKEWIKSVKPLINEEKQRYQYKTELKAVATNILKDHSDTSDKINEFDKLTNDIVDYFIEFNYNRDDDEAKQIYKMKLYNAVIDFFINFNKKDEVDPLVVKNQLLCELSKIPVPNDTILKEIVEEAKMKNEVDNFFKSTSLDDDSEKSAKMKNTLAKRLIDIEKLSHSDYSDKKMRSEITKCLNKLNKTAPPEVIEDFVNSLRNNEVARKTPALRTYHSDENFVNRQTSTTDTYRSRSPDDTVSRKISLPGPGWHQPSSTPNQLGRKCSQVSGRSHLSQTWVPVRTHLHNQSNGYYGSSTIQRNQTDPKQMIWSGCTTHQYQPGIYEQPQTAPSLHSSIAPREYVIPMSATAQIYRETPHSPCCLRKHNSIAQRSLHEASHKYPENLSEYQNAAGTDTPYSTEFQRCPSQQPSISQPSTYFEPTRTCGQNNYRSGTIDNQDQSLNYKPHSSAGRGNYPCHASEYQHKCLNYKPNGTSSESPCPSGMSHKRDNFLNYTPRRSCEQSNYRCGASEYLDQSLNYDNFKGRSMFTSSPILKQDIREAGGNSSRQLESSIFRNPCYEQASTPRRVQDEVQAFQPSAPRDIFDSTPGSLFEAPIFNPVPLLSLPTVQGRDIKRAYPPTTSSPRQYKMAKAETSAEYSGTMDLEEQVYQCVCGKKVKAFSSGRSCVIPMHQPCNQCSGFIPIWYRIPLPDCFY